MYLRKVNNPLKIMGEQTLHIVRLIYDNVSSSGWLASPVSYTLGVEDQDQENLVQVTVIVGCASFCGVE